jgi:putative ABC transport system substrate-binding protein
MIGRRAFITGLGVAAGMPFAARSQQGGSMRRIGVLIAGTATDVATQSRVRAFIEALGKAGWIEGRNISIDIRYNAADAALSRIYAAQLIGLMPNAILAQTTVNLTAIREATNTLPIVFTGVSDPVEQGFVGGIAKPGGNITGFANYEFSVGGKWLGLLKEMVPGLGRVAVMFNPDSSPQFIFFMRSITTAAPSLGLEVTPTPIHATAEIEPAIEKFARLPNGGLVLTTNAFTRLRTGVIAEIANRYRLPSLSSAPEYVRDGGLMYNGISDTSQIETFRQAATYVDRILKGEKPGDLPVQNPTRYELIINMKTAKSLGLTVPLPLLGLADAVIE